MTRETLLGSAILKWPGLTHHVIHSFSVYRGTWATAGWASGISPPKTLQPGRLNSILISFCKIPIAPAAQGLLSADTA